MRTISLLFLTYWLTGAVYAQSDKYSSQRELRGSGTLIRENRSVAAFQAIEIHQFLSNVTIEVGGNQSVLTIQIDDNLKPFLHITSVDGVLTLDFSDPANKPFWLGKGTVDVSIKTPTLNRLRNESNGNVVVTNLAGESFDLTNQGNGNVTLRGAVRQLSITSDANGDVRAQRLITQEARVRTQANATIDVNTRQLVTQNSGHATVRNVAKMAARPAAPDTPATPASDLVTFILQNNSAASRTVTLRFTEPDNPTYGVVSTTLGPYAKRRETYPVGTKIEQLSPRQQTIAMTGEAVQGRAIATLKANDNGRSFNLLD